MADAAGDRPPYEAAARLIATAGASADFDGWSAARNVDPARLSLPRVCNLVWYWLTRGADEKGRTKVETQLMRPLPGRETVSQDVVDFELALFEKAMSGMTRG